MSYDQLTADVISENKRLKDQLAARPEPDCRTCRHLSGTLRFECRDRGPTLCTNADRYEPLPPVRLWRTT